jgi:hypothetical protein
MPRKTLMTFGETASELGCTVHVVRYLVAQLAITPKRVPHCPAGKGLDPADLRAIRKALRPVRKSAAARAGA